MKKRHDTAAARLLRAHLDRAGTSAAAFARSIGQKPRTVQSWLAGVSIPRADTAWTMERATDGAVRCRDWAA